MRKFADRIIAIALYSPTERAELFIGLMAILWGLVLLNPYGAAFASTPTFSAMAQVARENVWGSGAFVTGTITFLALGSDWRAVRRWCAFAHALAWSFIAAMLAIGNPLGTGWVVYGLVAATAFLIFLRLGPRRYGT